MKVEILPAAQAPEHALLAVLVESSDINSANSAEVETDRQECGTLASSAEHNQLIEKLLEVLLARTNGPQATTAHKEKSWPPLESVTTPTVPTDFASHLLHMRPQTLRVWASTEKGPIRPIRINRRLGWSVSAIKSILGVK
jgi:hypothetical protein